MDATEISGYMMVFIVFGSLGRTFREGGLLRVELLHDRFPSGFKSIVDVILGAIALLYCVLLIKYSWQLVMNSYTNAIRSVSTYRILLYIPQCMLVFGGVVLFLTVIEYEISKIILLFSKTDLQKGGEED